MLVSLKSQLNVNVSEQFEQFWEKNTIFALRIELLLLRRLLSDFHGIFEKICDFDAPQGYFPLFIDHVEKNEGFFTPRYPV